MIEEKRLARTLPRALPVLKLWIDDEVLDLAEEPAHACEAREPPAVEDTDTFTHATDADAHLAPTIQHAPPASEHPAVPPGLGLEQYHTHVEQGSISEKSADIPFDLDVLLLQPCHARDNQSHPRPKISPSCLVPLPSRLLQIAEITRASPLRTSYVIQHRFAPPQPNLDHLKTSPE